MINVEGLNVLVIGPPASGKTHFINKLKFSGKVIHTDDYIKYGDNGIYLLFNSIKGSKTIIEGVMGYRLLRKGLELNCYHPDLVIELQVPEKKLEMIYNSERIGKDFNSVKAMIKANQTILNEYKSMPNMNKPYWITINNEY